MIKALVRALTIVLVAVAAVSVAAPAQASGGGCVTPPTNSDGWNIGVCTSDDGIYVYGDYYINRVGGPAGTCQSYLDIYDATTGTNLTGNSAESCAAGHHTWSSLDHGRERMISGHRYYAWVTIRVGHVFTAFSATNSSKSTFCC